MYLVGLLKLTVKVLQKWNAIAIVAYPRTGCAIDGTSGIKIVSIFLVLNPLFTLLYGKPDYLCTYVRPS